MLLPTAYLPPIDWCSACWNAEIVMIEAAENYQKGSLRNRAHFAGPNGVQRISIPLVKGKHQQTPIREVRIAYHENWQRQHWRSIRTAYGNAPYFEHYADELLFFYEQRYEFLFEYNLDLIRFILQKKMGWKGTILPSSDAQSSNIDFHQGAQNSLVSRMSPPAPAGEGTGVGLHYPQVFENKHGFLPNLSVLDLLFCCGKHGAEILSKTPIPAQ